MNVNQWITNHPRSAVTVPLNTSVEEAIDLMLAEPCARDVFVLDEIGKVVGHLSHIRLAKIILREHRPVHTRRQLMERVFGGMVGELMDPEVPVARLHEPMDEVFNRQLSKQLEDMPVIDDRNHLIGAINLSNVLREWRTNKDRNTL
ncbi:CBS domain-containing protein [Kaarinaea lacus]